MFLLTATTAFAYTFTTDTTACDVGAVESR